MPCYLIGVGSNLGNRQAIIDDAIASLRTSVDCLEVSQWFTYPAIGGPGIQQDFLNGVVRVRTSLDPPQLAGRLHDLERVAGRERVQRWSARPLDLDLLLADDLQIDSKQLTIPHPRMVTRRFVLEPAATVAPEMVHPDNGWTVQQLFEHLSAPPLFLVFAPQAAIAQELATSMAAAADGVILSLSAGERRETSVESATHVDASGNVARFPERPIIGYAGGVPAAGDFEFEYELGAIRPKLLLVAAPRRAEYSRRLRESSGWQGPVVYLSADQDYATQDAVGALQAMK